jgi:hypothetical protein
MLRARSLLAQLGQRGAQPWSRSDRAGKPASRQEWCGHRRRSWRIAVLVALIGGLLGAIALAALAGAAEPPVGVSPVTVRRRRNDACRQHSLVAISPGNSGAATHAEPPSRTSQ